ncbi:MAG: BamA/TamA family outer membrane protein [Fidelibacterota bacterium]
MKKRPYIRLFFTVILSSLSGVIPATPLYAADSVYFGNIRIASEIREKPQFDAILREYRELPATDINFQHFSRHLLQIPPSRGYHFPTLSLYRINPKSESGRWYLNPEVHLKWGDMTRIDTIVFRGHTKTRMAVLNRAVQPLLGAAYTEQQKTAILRSLRRFPFLSVAGENEIVLTKEGQTGILVSLQEQQDNEFIGVVGYVPGTYNSPGYFTGELDLKFYNLSGTGRQIFLYWSRANRYSQQVELGYKEPWIWKTNLYGMAEFRQDLRDTLVVIRNLGIGSGFYSNRFGSFECSLNREMTIPTPGGRNLLGLSRSKTTAIGVRHALDRRDHIHNPTSGFHLQSGIAVGHQKRDSLSSVSRLELNLALAGFVPVRQFWIIALMLNTDARWLSGAEPDFAEQYWFGGATDLRGYPNDFFRGSRIAWGTVELRRLIGNFSSFYLFFDQGYYQRFDDGKSVSGYPCSYGVGMRLASRMGIIGVDYGFGKGDTFSTAKIHIRLIGRF